MTSQVIFLDEIVRWTRQTELAVEQAVMDRFLASQPIQVKVPEMTVPIRDTKLIADCLASVGD